MRWIGIDGEGVGRRPHRYTMLCAYDADGRGDYIEDVRGLGTDDCLDFLYRLPARARLCGYYLGYDWTMVLRELPDEDIYRLFRPELRAIPPDEGGGFTRVHWRNWELHWLSGALTIKRRGGKARTIWDLAKFYQCKFVDAIERLPGIDRAMIARMKGERGTWSDDDLDRMLRYCREECRALAMLATDLERAHRAVDLVPNSWYGPGSTASLVLRRHDIHERRGTITPEIRDVAERAFFGGRFEQSRIGRVEGVYGYDIKSAYPAQAARLPCLEHATWRYTERESDLAKARWAAVQYDVDDIGAGAWAPLPCRLSDGTIVFARGGFTGWSWLDEYRAARAGWTGIRFRSAWILSVRCKHRPFDFVPAMYTARARGTDDEKRIYKYILNSIYGKLAQRIGEPKYSSVVWAGLITSGTRAELLRMICRHKRRESVIAVATDGLYSTERIACPKRPDLGEWERSEHGAMWFVRPGIYWSEDDETLRARGLGRAQLRRELDAVKRAIEAGESIAATGQGQFFGGAKQSVRQRPDGSYVRDVIYGEWYQRPTRIGLYPAPKRDPDWSTRVLDDVESRPYKVALSVDARTLEFLGELLAWGE